MKTAFQIMVSYADKVEFCLFVHPGMEKKPDNKYTLSGGPWSYLQKHVGNIRLPRIDSDMVLLIQME